MRLSLALLVALAGCGHGLTVRGAVVQPAQVPVRAFPEILVTSSEDPAAVELADRVAAHLTESRARVRRVEVRRVEDAALEAMRQAGRVGRATAVVRVEATLRHSDRPQWARRRLMTCGPLGCTDTMRPVIRDVPLVAGRAELRVLHGPTGQVLQREEVRDEESGFDDLGARLRVVERLGAQLIELLDQRTEEVRIELERLDLPAVARALAAIEAGDWRGGRRRLERVRRHRRFARLPVEARAAVLYDLGQACRFDATLAPEARFERASEALRAAVRLRPEPRYAEALADLDAHRRSRAMVLQQREAQAHNFALARRGEVRAPQLPDSYR